MADAVKAYEAAWDRVAQARSARETKLDFFGPEFNELTHLPSNLRGWTELEQLQIGWSEAKRHIADVGELRYLTGLKFLQFGYTNVRDLTPLADLKSLVMLELPHTPVADLSPLAGLPELVRLRLDHTNVSDFSSLLELQKLSAIYLSNTQVIKLPPLAKLDHLRHIDLSYTLISDITALAAVKSLSTFRIVNTPLRDISALRELEVLKGCNIEGTDCADLRPLIRSLENLVALERSGKKFTLSNSRFVFSNTPAARRDPKLSAIGKIEDQAEQTQELLAHLKTLPPWPEPLPQTLGEQLTGDRPTHPGNVLAPLMVQIDESGRLIEDTPTSSLDDAQKDRAQQAWTAIHAYLKDLDLLRTKIDNAMPNLGRALRLLEAALGENFDSMNEIALGMQAGRVHTLSADAKDYLLDQDPAELEAFVANLSLYLRRFNTWEAYKEDALTSPDTLVKLREDKEDFDGLRLALSEQGKIAESIDAKLSNLIEHANAPTATLLDAKALIDSQSNILDQVAEKGLAERDALTTDQWDELHEQATSKLKDKALDSWPGAVGIWAATYLFRYQGPINRLAARYPERFGFMIDVLRYLFP